MRTMPSHANSLAFLPRYDLRSDFVDDAGHLVPGNPRILQARPMSFLYKHVAMAHTTRLHLNANVAATRFWYISFYCFECGAGATNLHCGHLGHMSASTNVIPSLIQTTWARPCLFLIGQSGYQCCGSGWR